MAASLVEAGGTHFKTKLSSVATNISRGEVTERQLLDSLCVHLQNRDIWHRWSRLASIIDDFACGDLLPVLRAEDNSSG